MSMMMGRCVAVKTVGCSSEMSFRLQTRVFRSRQGHKNYLERTIDLSQDCPQCLSSCQAAYSLREAEPEVEDDPY